MRFILLILFTLIFSDNQEFDSSRAYNYVLEQCSLGPRFPGSPGHKLCKDYLLSELSNYADKIIVDSHNIIDPLTSEEVEIYNLFARLNPNLKNRILLLAHWDTRRFADKDLNEDNHKKPVLGANDGASGIAVILTLLSQINIKNYGIDILFADAEDMGNYGDAESWAIGSKLFSSKYPKPLPQFGICVDMVADKDLEFKVEQYSFKMAPQLVQMIWNIGKSKNYKSFKFEMGSPIIDDHLSFSKETGVPSINIIDLDYEFWHTVHDTPENISSESLGIVGDVLLTFLVEMDKNYER